MGPLGTPTQIAEEESNVGSIRPAEMWKKNVTCAVAILVICLAAEIHGGIVDRFRGRPGRVGAAIYLTYELIDLIAEWDTEAVKKEINDIYIEGRDKIREEKGDPDWKIEFME
ncbi:hypothetical protein ScPMuIL_010471 [Solemya velum]